MSAETKKNIELKIAHVLFLDIVGYSKLPLDEEHRVVEALNQMVRRSETFRAAETAGRLLKIPTGDGMVLVFSDSPEQPVDCALEISRSVRSDSSIHLRMGIHSGPVSGVVDVNERANVAGAGINTAQRIMDCGDAGHILLSKHVAEDLEHYPQWKARLHDLGHCKVKHGVPVHVINLYTEELGNPALPAKFRALRRRKVEALLGAIITLLVLGTLAALLLRRWQSQTSAAVIPEKSIAVLPFENLSEDKANAYFVAGIQDEVLTRLADLRELKVISRTSTRKYQSRPPDLRTVGKELGVSNILEGSVQKLANEVHINVQLIKVSTDEHLWAQSYDRTFEHVFAVEGEVAQAVANELKIALLPDQVEKLHAPPTLNPQAYDSFLEGQYAVDRAWEASGEEANKLLESAVRSFKDASARDPGFALAFAQLAEAELTQYRFGVFSGHPDQMAKALDEVKSHIDRALELAPKLAAAHAALGRWYVWGHSDYDAGLAAHKRAFALDPHLTEAIQGIAGIAQRSGRTTEAANFLTKALERDPRNLQLLRSLSGVYSMGRDYTRARQISAQTLALSHSDETDAANLCDSIWKETGDLKAADRVVESYLASLPPEKRNTSGILDQKRYLLWLSRDFIGLQKLIERTPAEAWSDSWSQPEWLGFVHEALGEKEAARKFYQQARVSILPAIAGDPNEPSKHAELAMIDAGLGLADEALAETHKAADLEPLAKNAMDGARWAATVAVMYAHLGRIDEAIKLLQQLFATPGTGDVLSPWYLRLDPWWDSLRADPRFKN